MIRSVLISVLFLGSHLSGQTLKWSAIQSTRDYKVAKEHLADDLPNLARPILTRLLEQENLDEDAKAPLLTLLGEAQLRSKLFDEALVTLLNPSLAEYSPAHLWRGYTLSLMGRYQEAIEAFQTVDRRSLIPKAQLQEAILMAVIGDSVAALAKLKPLMTANDPKVRVLASLRTASILLATNQLPEVEAILGDLKVTGKNLQGQLQYLRGRLHLAKNDRLAAVGSFQTLLNKTEDPEHGLSSALVHEATLALADSMALDGNAGDGVASVIDTLVRYPDSPRLPQLFQRLDQWCSEIDAKPIAEIVREWVPGSSVEPVELPILGFPTNDSVSEIASIAPSVFLPPRAAYALLFLASENLKEPETRALGRAQLDRLLIVAAGSNSNLRNRTLTQKGLAALADQEFELALRSFVRLRDSAESLSIQATASALIGKAAYALLDKKQASKAFHESQALATTAKNTELAAIAALNAGLSLLSTSDARQLDQITDDLDSLPSQADLLLERGLRLSSIDELPARELLDQFITRYPDHPRRGEAALSLAESYLFTKPRKVSLARNLLKPLDFELETQSNLEARRILAFLQMNEGMDLVKEFLKRLPTHPFSSRIHFQQAQAFQRIGVDGDAYQTYEIFLATYPKDPLAEVARLQSAISALATGTEASKADALKRLDELVEAKGVLSFEAAIQRARLFIDQGEQERALTDISDLLKTKGLATNYRWRLLVLAGEACYQLNDDRQALRYYNALLAVEDISLATRNRASYLKGRSLRNLENPDKALESFYSVVNRSIDPKRMNELEWKWFDECGKGALKLLEDQEEWRSAIKLAEKISRSGSPFAADASERAKRLRLVHMIWQDP